MKISSKMANLIKATMENWQAAIMTKAGKSESFEINKRVKQGDDLLTRFFNVALERNIRENNQQQISVLLVYANDLTIIVRDERSLQATLARINRGGQKRCLQINMKHTKYMLLN